MVQSYSTVFKDEGKLSPEYVPQHLPCREEQLKELINLFKVFLEPQASYFIKVWLVGGMGVGKTAVSKLFGALLERGAHDRGMDVHYLHINCYKEMSLFSIAKRMAQRVLPSVPERGFSSGELLEIVWRALEDQDAHLIVTLDGIDSLIQRNGGSTIYILSRIADERLNVAQRLGMILISRNLPSNFQLSMEASRGLTCSLITFQPYTSSQLLRILSERGAEAFHEGVVTPEVLETIARLTGIDSGGLGDARVSLELFWRSGKLAEALQLCRVDSELVRRVYDQIRPLLCRDDVFKLDVHKLMLLLAIAKVLKKGQKAYTGEVERTYIDVCKLFGQNPRKHTLVWTMIKELREMGYINTKVVGGVGGRTTLISLRASTASLLEEKVEEALKVGVGKGGSFGY